MAGASETKEETMSTFTTIAALSALPTGSSNILFRTVTDRLASYREARRSAAKL